MRAPFRPPFSTAFMIDFLTAYVYKSRRYVTLNFFEIEQFQKLPALLFLYNQFQQTAMSEQFHIIIAGDQHKPLSFKLSGRKIIISAAVILTMAVALVITGLFTSGLYTHNNYLAIRMSLTQKKIQKIKNRNKELEKKLAQVEAHNKESIEELKTQSNLLVSQIELEKNRKIAELEKKNLEQEMFHKEERDMLLSTAVSELNQRSEFIESVISNIGIKVKSKAKDVPKNSGGPFVAAENAVYDDLLYRADSYLKTIQTLPLGKPVNGSVSSWYGKRKDPINAQKAFHEGIDFRGRKGDPVYATADGKISYAGKNGGFGNFVRINHGNGYTTSFAHLDNYHVKKGDYVTRGQIIGLVGNSGRSTGTHLHYEIAYRGKHVNPAKFMKVANLTCKFDLASEK